MWALTYDDGPAKQTDEILNALAKRNLKATFFWLSKNAPSYATTAVARAKKEGHGLANHSATHAQLTKVSSAGLDREILNSTSDLEAIYGQKLGFFRLPYGAGRNDSSIRTRIEKAGLVHVYWNVDTLDWQDRNPTTVYQRTMKQVNQQGRGVILFHDIHSQTVTASARVMDDLKSLGSRVVTMQEALSVLNGETP
jgi:peptidoglycan/xylan/chitin deacetylase (PgdA/CDA1 family)